MRAVLIINPSSGDDEPNAHKVSRIQTYLSRGSFVAKVEYTSAEKSAGQIARNGLADGASIVIVGGGDGTVSEVARELIHKDATMGILPIGTFNNIARSLGIEPDLAKACGAITDGELRKIDVGIANEKDYFFEAAGAGLDAALFPIGEEIKGGRWSRIFHAAQLTLQYRAQQFEIEFDRPVAESVPPGAIRRFQRAALAQRRLRRKAHMIVVANGPYYGGGFTVAAGARVSDGKLTVSIYGRFSKFELIRHFRSISRGQHHYSPKIETYTASEVRLSAERPIPVHIDGHPMGCTPITLRVVPGALQVFAPERQRERGQEPGVVSPTVTKSAHLV